MKLEELNKEIGELWRDIRNKTREATSNYQGEISNYETNKKRAIISTGIGILTYPFIPFVGLVALGYGGIKTYQAYRDKKSRNQNKTRTIYRG